VIDSLASFNSTGIHHAHTHTHTHTHTQTYTHTHIHTYTHTHIHTHAHRFTTHPESMELANLNTRQRKTVAQVHFQTID
jgi:hypothetical protein